MPHRYAIRLMLFSALAFLSPAALAEPADLPAAPTPSTCGEANHEERPPWGHVFLSRFYPKQTFPARLAPTQMQQISELQMLQQGFVPIGWVEVKRFALLHPPSKPDAAIPGPASASAMALAETGRLGGDAFTLFRAEESVSEWADGGASGATRSGTLVRGMVWMRAPVQSRRQLLVYAAQHGQMEIVDRLLRAHEPVDSREPRFCQTALIAAASAGQSRIVQLLLAAGASRELTDTYGATALRYAAFPQSSGAQDCQCARLLRKAGAKEPDAPVGSFSFDFPAPRRCDR